jgi:hypothetical protein
MRSTMRLSLLLFTFLCCVYLLPVSGLSQYNLPNTPGEPTAPDTLVKDSLADTLKAANEITQPKKTLEPQETEPEVTPADARKLADTWVRRLLLRGWLDNSHIGAYASYQLTGWRRGLGSFGPVEARVTIYYLGPTAFLGKDAEWLQVVFRVMGETETIIEYDLTVSGTDRIADIYRVLYRVDHGDLATGNFNLQEGELDYDRADQPQESSEEVVRLYTGSFDTKVYVGSGSEGAIVYAYRANSLPPLGLVILGYGEEALTLTATGADARPRMNVPPPPTK